MPRSCGGSWAREAVRRSRGAEIGAAPGVVVLQARGAEMGGRLPTSGGGQGGAAPGAAARLAVPPGGRFQILMAPRGPLILSRSILFHFFLLPGKGNTTGPGRAVFSSQNTRPASLSVTARGPEEPGVLGSRAQQGPCTPAGLQLPDWGLGGSHRFHSQGGNRSQLHRPPLPASHVFLKMLLR